MFHPDPPDLPPWTDPPADVPPAGPEASSGGWQNPPAEPRAAARAVPGVLARLMVDLLAAVVAGQAVGPGLTAAAGGATFDWVGGRLEAAGWTPGEPLNPPPPLGRYHRRHPPAGRRASPPLLSQPAGPTPNGRRPRPQPTPLMLPTVVLSGVLAFGQPPAPPPAVEPPLDLPVTAPAPAPPAATAAPTPRSALMQAAQGTWLGALLDDRRLSVSGWADLTATASSRTRTQLPVGFNYLANSFLLQQSWLRVERTVDEAAKEPTWGFRSDTILPGADYRFTLARGLFDSQLTSNDGRPERYGIDPVQFYGQLYLPQVGRGLNLQLGRFFAAFGVDSIDGTLNQLYSHSYTFIYNPFTHTGLLATHKLTDTWTAQSGIVAGSDVFLDAASSPTVIGSLKWAPPAGRATAQVAVILGRGRFDTPEGFSNPQVFDLVVNHKLSDRTSYTVNALYSFQRDFPGRGFVNNWGVVQYLTHQFASQLSGTARLEFFGDPQGYKTGTEGRYTGATAGVTYKPLRDLWLRPELRYDHCADGRPFEGKRAVATATMSLLVRW